MHKIKLSEIDKSFLKSYLKYDEKKINKDWIMQAAGINVILILVAAYMEGYKSVASLIFYIICAIIIVSLIYFLKRVEHNKKNLYLYFGIYTSFLSVSTGWVSYVLLKKEISENNLWIIISITSLSFIVAIITYFTKISKISSNSYENKNSKIVQSVGAGAISCGILAVKQLEVSGYILFGVCFGIIAIASAGNIHFIIKYYCYRLLEISEEQKLNKE